MSTQPGRHQPPSSRTVPTASEDFLVTPIPSDDPKRVKLLDNVKDALRSIGVYFDSSTYIEGAGSQRLVQPK